MEVKDFKEELSKKIVEFQQRLFDVDDLEELKEEIENLKEELKIVSEEVEEEIDSTENNYYDQDEDEDDYYEEENDESEENSDDLDSMIKKSEKNLGSNSNNSLLDEYRKLGGELG